MAGVRVESVPATAPETTADTSGDTATASRPRLLLLDGHSLAYRAFFALPVENFSTTTGQHTNAVYGFTAMLINVLRDEQPTHLAVAFDVSRKTFRSEAYSDYKANRSKSPDEFQGQVSLIKEVLNALRVPFVEKDGFEADDIIGTLATQALEDDFDVLICSGDRDSFQLVGEHTTVIYPMRGVSEMKRMTPAAVEEKYGVPPSRYPELAALVGESSDNLPGVPGVGPKTAAKWILTYDGLTNVVNQAEDIKGKAGESLREHLDDVIRNRQLNALVLDLDLPLKPTDLAMQPWDRQEVHTLFDGLEFRVLRDRLFETLESEEDIDDSGFALDMTRLAPGEVGGWLADNAHDGRRVGVFAEGSWRSGTGDVQTLSFATADGTAAHVVVDQVSPEDDAAIVSWFGDPDQPKVLHDAKGPMLALAARGLAAGGPRSRHRALGVPRPARPALLRPRRPDGPLPQARAEAERGRRRPAQPRRPGGRHQRDRDAARQRGARPRGGPRRRARRPRRHRPAGRRRAAAHRRARPDGAGRHRRRPRPAHRARGGLRRPGARRGRGGVRRGRQGGQPRLAQAAPGDPLRGARHAEDQAHQDRLHHRRRRAAGPLREDRSPVPRAPARAPRRDPAPPDRRRACSRPSPTTAASTPPSTS